jgi:hypothetical protein
VESLPHEPHTRGALRAPPVERVVIHMIHVIHVTSREASFSFVTFVIFVVDP